MAVFSGEITGMQNRMQYFTRREPLFFYLLCLAGLLPALLNKYFVTLDGPAHLYNAGIIKELITGGQDNINDLFRLNDIPVPNWTAHFLMAVFSLLMPAHLAEKLFVVLYLFLTPVFFRKFISSYKGKAYAASYLMLLFVHNHLFYFGFYNMSAGIMFMFILFYYYRKHCNSITKTNLLIITLLWLVLYFSHIFVFLSAIPAILIITYYDDEKGFTFSAPANGFLRKLIILFVSIVPAAFLAVNYFLNVESLHQADRLSNTELARWIVDVRPLLSLCYCEEWKILTHIVAAMLALVLITSLVYTVRNWNVATAVSRPATVRLRHTLAWAALCLAYLVLFLLTPNAIMLSDRLILMFFLFLLTWIGMLSLPKWLNRLSLITVALLLILFTRLYYSALRPLSVRAGQLTETAGHAAKGSLILTFNYSDNWLHNHLSGYAGASGPYALLENYEAALKWFPVRWDNGKYELSVLQTWEVKNRAVACSFYLDERDTTCFSLKANDNSIKPLEYVLVTGDMKTGAESCDSTIRHMLGNYYAVVNQNDFATLFQLKR